MLGIGLKAAKLLRGTGADDALRTGYKSSIGKAGAWGSGIGGMLGGIGSQFDDEDGWADTAKDIGVGMLFGGTGGGLFGYGRKRGASLLGGAAGITGITGALGHGLGADFGKDEPVDSIENAVRAAGQPVGSTQGQGISLPEWMKDQKSYFGDLGAPDVSTRSLSDWMADPELNRVANAQIIAGNAAIMREQQDLRKNMSRDLEANEALGDEYQIQAAQIGRDNAQDTAAIINAASDNQRRIADETDEMHERSAASLMGNEHTREGVASELESQEARLNEARISDQELLERLGVSGQEMLGELAAAEAAQTKDNAVKIRTSAMDQITKNRSEAKDAWRFEKPTILGSLAQGAMDREVQQRQFGLQGYQMKMQQASQVRDAQQSYLQSQQELQAATQGAGPNAEMLNSAATGSGIKVMGPGGQPIELPVWINSPEMAAQRGVDEATFNMWQKLIQTPEIAEQLGMVQ